MHAKNDGSAALPVFTQNGEYDQDDPPPTRARKKSFLTVTKYIMLEHKTGHMVTT